VGADGDGDGGDVDVATRASELVCGLSDLQLLGRVTAALDTLLPGSPREVAALSRASAPVWRILFQNAAYSRNSKYRSLASSLQLSDPRILELVFSFMRANPPAQNQNWCNEQILVAVTKVASPGANPADFATKLRYQVGDLRGMSRHAIIVSTR